MATDPHHPHPAHHRLEQRIEEGVATTERELTGFNGWLAVKITDIVGTMWCAYAFAALALVSLPTAIAGGTGPLVAWIAQTFLQLVLLSIIMVGQKVQSEASDKQATQTYRDAEALLQMNTELHRLATVNNRLTAEIHAKLSDKAEATSAAPPS